MLSTITEFVGRFHPVIVHLPIGFLLVGLLLQWLSSNAKYRVSQEVIKVVFLTGMFAALLSCITGYLRSLSEEYDDDLVSWHMWMGICVAVLSVLFYAKNQHIKNLLLRKLLSLALLFAILLTGHLGGSLTHGANYLALAWENLPDTASIAAKKIADVQEAVVYTDVVKPLLQSRCYNCHGERKQKSDLRLDAPQWIIKGGKNGAILSAKANESELIKRLLLPREDDDHMPPKQKPQLNEKEIALIHWWVEQGADFTKKVKDLTQPENIQPYLLALQEDHPQTGKAIPLIPGEPVEKVDEKAFRILKEKGVIIMPVAQNSNYFMANFISAIGISDRDIPLLLPAKKQLVWIKLNNVPITDSSLSALAQCRNLTIVQLNNTKVTDKGIAMLASLNKLQSLSIIGTRVTARGLLPLKSLKNLQSIYLYQSAIDKKDFGTLKKAFPGTVLDTGGYTVPLLASDTTLVQHKNK